MLMEGPVAAQFLIEAGGQRHDAILMALALSNEQFVFLATHVVNGQTETLAQAQAAGVDRGQTGAVVRDAHTAQGPSHLVTPKDHR